MVDQITFRTDDNLRWGPGQGSDLSATEIDINFWVLYSAVTALQASFDTRGAGIDHFVISGTNLFVHLTNHFVLGPYTLPVANWNFRGPWVPSTSYGPFDVFTNAGAVYLVLISHVSNSLFSPGSNDGHGHNFYGTLLVAPPPELPQTGATGAFLQWQNSPGDVRWYSPTRNLAFYLETIPDPLEVILEYVFTEKTTFPIGLTNSRAKANHWPTVTQQFNLYQDGASIGSIDFHPSPTHATFTCPVAIVFNPGSVLTIVAPSVPDPHMSGIAATLVGILP